MSRTDAASWTRGTWPDREDEPQGEEEVCPGGAHQPSGALLELSTQHRPIEAQRVGARGDEGGGRHEGKHATRPREQQQGAAALENRGGAKLTNGGSHPHRAEGGRGKQVQFLQLLERIAHLP